MSKKKPCGASCPAVPPRDLSALLAKVDLHGLKLCALEVAAEKTEPRRWWERSDSQEDRLSALEATVAAYIERAEPRRWWWQ